MEELWLTLSRLRKKVTHYFFFLKTPEFSTPWGFSFPPLLAPHQRFNFVIRKINLTTQLPVSQSSFLSPLPEGRIFNSEQVFHLTFGFDRTLHGRRIETVDLNVGLLSFTEIHIQHYIRRQVTEHLRHGFVCHSTFTDQRMRGDERE